MGIRNRGSSRRKSKRRQERQADSMERTAAHNAVLEERRAAEAEILGDEVTDYESKPKTSVEDILSEESTINIDTSTIEAVRLNPSDPKAQQAEEEFKRVREFEEELERNRDQDLLADQLSKDVIAGNEEDILETEQNISNLNSLEKSLEDQIAQRDRKERDLFRESQRAERAEEELGIRRADLDRQSGALDRSMSDIDRQAEQFQTDLTRERGLTRRAGRVAANSSQQANAQAANMQAQGGLGRSSAIQGAMASARSASATKAGDILTGLTTLQQQETAGLAGLANARAGILDARAGLQGEGTRMDHIGAEIRTRRQDLLHETNDLGNDFDRNVRFMREQFDLGTSMQSISQHISETNQAYNQQQAQKASGFQTAIAGIGVGAAGFTGAPIIGGLIVAKGVADYFDF